MIRFRQDDVDENFDIDEEESLDMGPDMNLVNGPNPWLPAYGFQIQHHNSYNSTHEDLRTNGLLNFLFLFVPFFFLILTS